MMKINNKKTWQLRGFIFLAIIILINILASNLHLRLDLTSENRFTLSKSTKIFLKTIDEDVDVTVYLKGNFKSGFKNLQEATRLTLSDFKNIIGKKFHYRFINPLEGINDPAEQKRIYQSLAEKGITPVNLNIREDINGSNESSIIFPKALITYKGKSLPVNLLEQRIGLNSFEQLNISENLLENKISNALQELSKPEKDRIAIIVGQGESLGWESFSALYVLSQKYILDTVDITLKTHIASIYKAALIIKPTMTFDEKAKFKIDQYVMHGGKLVWFIDKLFAKMEDLQNQEATMAVAQDINLDDMLFNFGVRINADYVEDLSCNPIPLIVGEKQGVPQTEFFPWVYYPIYMPSSKHPLVQNLENISGKFSSTIDTIQNNIKKTILLNTSEYSRIMPSPVRVSLSSLKYEPDQRLFNNGNKPVAVLLEGKFNSIYQNRLPESFLKLYKDSFKQDYLAKCDTDNKMIVISDGDIILNEVNTKTGPYPLGFYQYTKTTFGNEQFLLNCIDYLVNENNLLESRSKEFKLRVLDLKKAKNNKLKWQLINIVVPVILILLFGSSYIFFRKRKYEVKK